MLKIIKLTLTQHNQCNFSLNFINSLYNSPISIRNPSTKKLSSTEPPPFSPTRSEFSELFSNILNRHNIFYPKPKQTTSDRAVGLDNLPTSFICVSHETKFGRYVVSESNNHRIIVGIFERLADTGFPRSIFFSKDFRIFSWHRHIENTVAPYNAMQSHMR